MAIKSKVYTYLRKYLDEYLYGFEKDQLDVAVLAGHIDLSNVNFKPAKVNRLLSSLGLPFQLKAGLIGKLSFKYHYSSMLSSPLELEIHELLLILGPLTNEPPFDFVKLKGPDSDEELPDNLFIYPENYEPEFHIDENLSDEKSFVNNYFRKILKNLTLTVHTLHIRYEDDLYPYMHPFAFGFSLEKFEVRNDSKEWFVGIDGETSKLKPPKKSYVKDCKLTKLLVHMSSMASMLVPTSLWEETMESQIGIFEAIAAYEIRDLILEEARDVASDPSRLFCAPTDVYCCLTMTEGKGYKWSVHTPSVKIRVSSAMAECYRNFQEYFINSKLWWVIGCYRPKFNIPRPDHCKNEKERKLRKKIIRQWFRYTFKFFKARSQLKKFVDFRRNHLRERMQAEEDARIQANKNPKNPKNTQLVLSVPEISVTFFDDDLELSQVNSIQGVYVQILNSEAEIEYSCTLTRIRSVIEDRTSKVELFRSGRLKKTGEQVEEGFFRNKKTTVVLREAQHALQLVGKYRGNAISGASDQYMYELQSALSRLHIKYSPSALNSLLDLYQALKFNKDMRKNHRIFVRKEEKEKGLINSLEERVVRQFQDILDWTRLKQKQLQLVDLYFSMHFNGAKVRLKDSESSCELAIPKGQVVAAKDDKVALFKLWSMQIVTQDSLYGFFQYISNLNKSLGDKVSRLRAMISSFKPL